MVFRRIGASEGITVKKVNIKIATVFARFNTYLNHFYYEEILVIFVFCFLVLMRSRRY
jgi:hypothetical protein